MDIIHHYTDINKLALILKNKCIRFNRLDRVDDMSEAQATNKFNLAQYLFVSCWTDDAEESIPLWHMYSKNMTGVRISLPKEDIFNYQPLRAPQNWNITQQGILYSPIPFNKMFTDDYFITPNFLDKKQFERKVEYVDNVADYYKDAVTINTKDDGKTELKINSVFDLAKYKRKVWGFQSELRFLLFILPSIPIPEKGMSDPVYLERFPNHIINCLINNIPPKINFFDVEINPNVLDNITITMGPYTEESDRILVDSMLKMYTKNGSCKESNLRGTIRKPAK